MRSFQNYVEAQFDNHTPIAYDRYLYAISVQQSPWSSLKRRLSRAICRSTWMTINIGLYRQIWQRIRNSEIQCPAPAAFERCAGRMPGGAKGQRGGLRIIYYHFKSDCQIWLVTAYDKDEASDITAKEKKALRTAIESELAARAARRVRPSRSRRIW